MCGERRSHWNDCCSGVIMSMGHTCVWRVPGVSSGRAPVERQKQCSKQSNKEWPLQLLLEKYFYVYTDFNCYNVSSNYTVVKVHKS